MTTTPTPSELDKAIERLFEYLDYVRPDAPSNSIDPYQVSISGAYSFSDLRLIRDALAEARRDLARLDYRYQAVLAQAASLGDYANRTVEMTEEEVDAAIYVSTVSAARKERP